jgi:hypothetical protein
MKKSFNDFINKYKIKKLPNWIDLRSNNGCPAVLNKENLKIDSIISVSNAIRFLLKKKNDDFQPSILYMYYFSRLISNNLNQNEVKFLDIFKSIKMYGFCSEKEYKYDIQKINDKPEIKGNYKYNLEFYKVNKNINDIKKTLIDGKPILLSCKIFKQFTSNEANDYGKIILPKICEKNIDIISCCIYGYRNSNKTFICMYNIGNNWGEKGFFYLPFDYVKKYSCELYTIDLK